MVGNVGEALATEVAEKLCPPLVSSLVIENQWKRCEK